MVAAALEPVAWIVVVVRLDGQTALLPPAVLAWTAQNKFMGRDFFLAAVVSRPVAKKVIKLAAAELLGLLGDLLLPLAGLHLLGVVLRAVGLVLGLGSVTLAGDRANDGIENGRARSRASVPGGTLKSSLPPTHNPEAPYR